MNPTKTNGVNTSAHCEFCVVSTRNIFKLQLVISQFACLTYSVLNR